MCVYVCQITLGCICCASTRDEIKGLKAALLCGGQPLTGTTAGFIACSTHSQGLCRGEPAATRRMRALESALCVQYRRLENVKLFKCAHFFYLFPPPSRRKGTCPPRQQPIWATRHPMEAGAGLSSLAPSSPLDSPTPFPSLSPSTTRRFRNIFQFPTARLPGCPPSCLLLCMQEVSGEYYLSAVSLQ